jgi:hypothetical protein
MCAQPSLTVARRLLAYPAHRAEGYEVILINSNPVRPSRATRASGAAPQTAQSLPAACVFCARSAPPRPCTPAPRLTRGPRPRQQATIMTDPDTANRTYIGPMTPELVETIIAKARHPRCIAALRPLPAAHEPMRGVLRCGRIAACDAAQGLTPGTAVVMSRRSRMRFCPPWAARPRSTWPWRSLRCVAA